VKQANELEQRRAGLQVQEPCTRRLGHLGRDLLYHPAELHALREQDLGERLPPLHAPLPDAWRARLGSRWVCTNESPESMAKLLGPTIGHIDELKELSGYILWNNRQLLRVVDDLTAGMTIKVPGFAGRDLVELRMVTVSDPTNSRGSSEELHEGSFVFQRQPHRPEGMPPS